MVGGGTTDGRGSAPDRAPHREGAIIMTMGDRIRPSHRKSTDPVVDAGDSVNPAPGDTPRRDAEELSEPNIKQSALADASP